MESTNGQYLKRICKYILYLGLGNVWYEDMKGLKKFKYLYKAYFAMGIAVVSLLVTIQMPVLLNNQFSATERTDTVFFFFGQLIIVMKVLFFVYKSSDIKGLLVALLDESLIGDARETQEKARKKAKLHMLLFSFGTGSTLFFYGITGIQKMFKGEPFYTVVTAWPFRDDVSLIAQSIRALYIPPWAFMMCMMLSVDALTITVLIFISFKFVTLRTYFEDMRKWFQSNPENKTSPQIEAEFKEKLIVGLRFHIHILRCAQLAQDAFWGTFSLSVGQTLFLVSIALLRYMITERSIANSLSTAAILTALLVLLGIYMVNSGDLNYEASLVPDAIFQCGWELCVQNRKELKHLILMGSLQGQMPVQMKSFSIFEMSHGAFVVVLKTSYSLFAVFY